MILRTRPTPRADGTSYPYKLTTFTADKISLGSGVAVNISGSNPISLCTRNHGDLTINTTINISGGDATENPNAGGVAKAGGFDGGLSKTNGQGPGKGKGYADTTNGGGGAYGGHGSESDAGYSLTYGSPDLSTHLLGGSGAGGGDWYPGGAGGGAIELFAHGDGVLTIGGSIKANGGDAAQDDDRAGGGGSGGAIRLEGGSIVASGTLEAKGGSGLTHTPGGGGRIAIKTNGNLTLGTVALNGYRPAHCIFPVPPRPIRSIYPVVPSPLIPPMVTGTILPVFMALEPSRKKRMMDWSISLVPSLSIPSIWHPVSPWYCRVTTH